MAVRCAIRPNRCFGIVPATVRDYRLPFRSDRSATWQRQLAAGGDEQNRTVDPLLARQVLSQLSYAPVLGLCLGESTLLSSLFGGPSKLNSVKLTR